MNCPYIHNDKCNRGCRGFQCRNRDEAKSDAVRAATAIHAERASADWRRLTGLWRYGVTVLPPACTDFYAWLDILDAAIDERTNRAGTTGEQRP